MATTETDLSAELQLADLLQRVEALEEKDGKRIEKKNKLTIIAWGGDLDRIWPTTILATTAAASGMESSVFFTFWGLFAIVKPDVRVTGSNWMQKMMSVMNPGSAQKAKLIERGLEEPDGRVGEHVALGLERRQQRPDDRERPHGEAGAGDRRERDPSERRSAVHVRARRRRNIKYETASVIDISTTASDAP